MIDIIVSTNCPHCHSQLDNMRKSYFEDEYRIIMYGTRDFESHPHREAVKGFPFVIVYDENGSVKYSDVGVHDGTQLRKIERQQAASLS